MIIVDAENPTRDAIPKISSTKISIWLSMIIQLLTSCTVVAATYVTVGAQSSQQHEQFQRESKEAQRQIRRPIYARFLAAFNQFNVAIGPYSICMQLSEAERRKRPTCAGATASQAARLLSLRESQDEISVYGSNLAVKAVNDYMNSIGFEARQRVADLEKEEQVLAEFQRAEGQGQAVNLTSASNDQALRDTRKELDTARRNAKPAPSAEAVNKMRSDFQQIIRQEINA